MSDAYGRSDVDVTAVGLVCPLGRHALQAALLARAGRQQVRPTPFAGWSHREDDVEPSAEESEAVADAADAEKEGRGGRPQMCYLSDLPDDCVGFERMLRLAVPALRQLGVEPDGEPLPLLLALPPAGRADDDDERAAEFAATLARRASVRVDRERSHTIRGRHASAGRLLALGAELLESGAVPAVVVGGVDSYFHAGVLRDLDAAGQLLGPDESDGFLPGEAAAFVLLRRGSSEPAEDPSGAQGTAAPRCLARLCCAETATVPAELLVEELSKPDEPETPDPSRRPQASPGSWLIHGAMGRNLRRLGIRPERLVPRRRRSERRSLRRRKRAEEEPAVPDVADTMSELVERVTKAWPGVPIEWVLSDRNFSRDRSDQWSTVELRALPATLDYTHFAEELGDVGAATLPTLIALACASWAAQCAPASSALVAAHSDDGERAALLLRTRGEGHE